MHKINAHIYSAHSRTVWCLSANCKVVVCFIVSLCHKNVSTTLSCLIYMLSFQVESNSREFRFCLPRFWEIYLGDLCWYFSTMEINGSLFVVLIARKNYILKIQQQYIFAEMVSLLAWMIHRPPCEVFSTAVLSFLACFLKKNSPFENRWNWVVQIIHIKCLGYTHWLYIKMDVPSC